MTRFNGFQAHGKLHRCWKERILLEVKHGRTDAQFLLLVSFQPGDVVIPGRNVHGLRHVGFELVKVIRLLRDSNVAHKLLGLLLWHGHGVDRLELVVILFVQILFQT
jgi:hypothetical protein